MSFEMWLLDMFKDIFFFKMFKAAIFLHFLNIFVNSGNVSIDVWFSIFVCNISFQHTLPLHGVKSIQAFLNLCRSQYSVTWLIIKIMHNKPTQQFPKCD